MKYEFACTSCDHSIVLRMKPDDLKPYKDNDENMGPEKAEEYLDEDHSLCDCQDSFSHQFNPEGFQVCWKGLQWADKNYREKKHRKAKSKRLKKRQYKEHHVPELKPNYQGQRTESWREAKDKAEKDAHPRLAGTYDRLINDEDS